MNKQILFAVIPSLIAFLLIGISIAAATPLSSQSGTISSTQNSPDGKPAWKVSGTWNLINLYVCPIIFDMIVMFPSYRA
jgi:hypothetical protein